MADIRLAVDFFDHPKTQMLQAEHGLEAIVSLMRIWQWSAVNRPKGILRGLDEKRLAVVARCSVEMIGGMIEEGFIDKSKSGMLKLHNWKKHQGYIYYSDERSAQARKAALARHHPKSLKKDVCSQQANSNAPSPDPDPIPLPKKKRVVFTPPTLAQITKRCQEMGYQLDPSRFFHYYESNGWKVGKNKMKSWESSLAGWESRDKADGNNGKKKLTGSEMRQAKIEEMRRRENAIMRNDTESSDGDSKPDCRDLPLLERQ